MHVLGVFEIEGVAPERLGSRKARTLLRALALGRGQPVTVDRLVEACWGEQPPARPADQVAVLVSRLRGVLGRDRIVRHDTGYSLIVDWLDVDTVEELADEAGERLAASGQAAARSAALAALSLARGPLLADEPDASWAAVDRAAAERLVARLRHLAAEAALAAGDPAEAATLAAGALDHDLYDETALRLLMAAWARAGRPASALAAYAGMRERLAEDLGVSPAPDTEALHTAILRGEQVPGLPGAAAGGLAEASEPAPAGDLPGRDDALAALTDALQRVPSTGTYVVSIEGEAGIGKTTVLDAWAVCAAQSDAIVLRAVCDELERSLPLQPVLDALASYLRTLDREDSAELLGNELALLGPLLGESVPSPPGAKHALVDGPVGPTLLFGALLAVLGRVASRSRLALLLDDMHLAGSSTFEWLRFAQRRGREWPMLIVAARRTEEGPTLGADHTIMLRRLDLAETARVVGAARAEELHARSGGHPLFLVELAAADPADELPVSIRDAVAARCERAGAAAETLRTAALLGSPVDLDLLASVMRRSPIEVLEHLEQGSRRGILDSSGATFEFTHDLVRSALAAGMTTSRAALVHREAARSLAARGHADPLDVAYHARLGGDQEIAAGAFAEASRLAAARWDHEVAEALLDRALQFGDATGRRLERARVRMLRGRYAEAIEDAELALADGAGAAALEVAGWASYWDRELETARQFADDSVRVASDAPTRASALLLAGRLRHVTGDLDGAEQCFIDAAALAEGPGLTVASVWLGTLRSHQSRLAEALDLLRAATRPGGPPGQVGARLHALLFTAHALALSGQVAAALDTLSSYELEVERTQVLRFAGRAENFRAWILRSLGAHDEADELNQAAIASTTAIPETSIAAHLDLADGYLHVGDLDRAAAELDAAESRFAPDIVFGWRQHMKAHLHRARLQLALDRLVEAEALASELAGTAERLGVPRYAAPARLLVARARAHAGEPVDLDIVATDLDALDRVAALESWWITADVARTLRSDVLADRARDRAARLASGSGDRRESLLAYAGRSLDRST